MIELKNAMLLEYFKIAQTKVFGNSKFIDELSESLLPISTAIFKTEVFINKSIVVFEIAYSQIQKFIEDFSNQLTQCEETSNSKSEFFSKLYMCFNEYSINSSKIVMTNVSK
jgi:hypothetical protein